MASIASVTSTAAQSSSQSVKLPQQTLNQNDFLNLLVTQMQNQDPMNPMSDTDFIAQMAQFSTLQQSQQTYTSIANLQANSLIGRVVTVQADGGNANTGTVSQVVMVNGIPNLLVNGQAYTLSELQAVAPAPTTTTATSASTTTP